MILQEHSKEWCLAASLTKQRNVARNSISAKEDNCEPACSVAIVHFNITFQNFKKCIWSDIGKSFWAPVSTLNHQRVVRKPSTRVAELERGQLGHTHTALVKGQQQASEQALDR